MRKLLALLFVASVGLAAIGCNGGSSDTGTDSTAKSGVSDKTPKTDGED